MNYGYVDVTLASEKYILVDSDVLIDVLRLVPLAAAVVQDVKKVCTISHQYCVAYGDNNGERE